MRSGHFLLIGMALGLSLALLGLGRAPSSSVPEHVAARVDGHDIAFEEWAQAVKGVEDGLKRPLTPPEKQDILDTLIREQLLLSHGLDLELLRQSPPLRKQTVAAVLELVRSEAELSAPSDEQLRAFWRDNIEYFRAPDQSQLQLFRALDAASLDVLGPQAPDEKAMSLRDPGLPGQRLPLNRLELLVGAEIAAQIADLKAGQWSPTIPLGEGFARLYCRDRQPGQTSDFASQRDRVEREWRRREAEASLDLLYRQLAERYPVQRQDQRLP